MLAAALIGGVALGGIVLSKSRGAGIVTLVILAGTWGWGLLTLNRRMRRFLRCMLPIATILLILGAALIDQGYFRRFGAWFGWEHAREQSLRDAIETASESVQRSARWVMFSGAMQAWVDAPLLGIGPGMHQNIWPHVAASGDGDIEQGIWPTRLNNDHYSYEVHNDWAQLLEEYGLVGFLLFLCAAVSCSGLLLRGFYRAVRQNHSAPSRRDVAESVAVSLGAWLAVLAIGVHSLGDFNLQMPATTWLFAAIVALGVRAGMSRALAPGHASTRESATE